MNEIDTDSWESFELKLKELRESIGGSASPLLFRGQSNAKWPLATTLERAGIEGMSFRGYYLLITSVRPAIETFTGVKWDLPDYSPEFARSFEDHTGFDKFPSGSAYRYMVYLRHHGFPSPLLDWSLSPYIAAFFAFREPSPEADKRSIYAFCEKPTGFKGWTSSGPRIRRIGPYIRSHQRHFRQQSDYTMCGQYEQAWHFGQHEEIFALGNSEQDVLWKFNIPSTERIKVLQVLDRYNLNAFSLFDSEDALMETMWFREMIRTGGIQSAYSQEARAST